MKLSVSIHARPIGRAIDDLFPFAAMYSVFQSTPDQLVGRFWVFNEVLPSIRVSIHARPIGRAIISAGLRSRLGIMFQSTPDQLVGRFSARSSVK